MNHFLVKTMAAVLTLSALVACGEDAVTDDALSPGNGKTLENISITGKDFQLEQGTRSTVEIDNSGVHFLWSEGDIVGIFPDKGSQAEFEMSSGAGMQSATFNGGGWALKAASKYAAYFPYDFYNRDLKAIPVSYEGQTQTGNNSTAHLGAYDFMAAGVSTPAHGAVAFDMQHMGALVRLQTDLGEAKILTNVSIASSGNEFTTAGTIDLTAVNPQITATATSNTLNIPLNNFTVADDETTTIYLMLAPVNLFGETLEITFSDEVGEYIKFDVEGKNFVAGKAYAYTLTDGEKINTITYNAVDLGLSSGTLWADRNVGADSPEAYGDYFAWGEVTPKTEYDWSTYKWCNGDDFSQTKYCTDSSFGTIDGKITLELEDDAAYVNMGSYWRMPTTTEQRELINNCTWTWTTQNGVNGYKVTGPNGNSIFLPVAGYRFSGGLDGAGSYGFYWSSSLNGSSPSYAYHLFFRSYGYYWDNYYRYYGLSVRAVMREK